MGKLTKIGIGLIVFSLLFIAFFFYNKSHTTLLEFNYGGFGDTICATLKGKIIEKNLLGETPLNNVKITFHAESLIGKNAIKDTSDKYFTSYFPFDTIRYTDSEGNFSMGFLNRERITITIHKEGFETLVLKNYLAKPDQTSTCKVTLAKGSNKLIQNIKK